MVNSDHCPILINTDGRTQIKSKTFKFQGVWTRHPKFLEAVTESWKENATVWSNRENVARKLQEWNKNTFGNIHTKKRQILKRLGGIQRCLDNNHHSGIIKLERKIRADLDEILHQEEVLWYQQARESWIASGDRNTKFYHAATKIKQARKRGYKLLDDNTLQVLNEEKTEQNILHFFKDIFTKDCTTVSDVVPKGKFPHLSEIEWNSFNAQFTIEEVKAALFDMDPLKAPGPDGFHACFYQKAWQVVGQSVFMQFHEFIESGRFEEGMNDTLVALIPKVTCPTSANQFRPISLCNVIYKIITKALTNRIKPILKKLISPEQSSFVPGRQITDNILVYQEVLHSMRTRNNSTGYMILKIDLEKAYDRLDWDFIKDTLIDIGMSTDWVRNVMSCVTSSKLKILWNGKQLDQIIPTRGIRQGDAISPYIFVLCMERLSHLIKEEVQRGKWRGIRLSRYSPTLTHLFFADDLVLFAEASQDQIMVIKQCLERFSTASGQKVSLNKSQIFFSKNVGSDKARALTELAGIPPTNNLGKYLGVPSIHGRITKELFNPILDKMDERLEGWKMRFLSIAGRQVLAQSVLHSIPYYTMQTMLMPAGIWEEIDKRVRRFLWGGTPEKRRCHLVRWDIVTKPKNSGGLGIRSTKEVNLAFMAKLGWKLLNNEDCMWVEILKAKYAHGRKGMNIFEPKRISSNAWRGIVSALPTIREGIRFNVGNGRTTRFWSDAWVQERPLSCYLTGDVQDIVKNKMVRDYWRETGGWDWNELPNLPESVKECMELISFEEEELKDELTWQCEASGMFSMKSAYSINAGNETNLQEPVWSNLWRIKVPNKMKFFVWTALHDKIMGNAERKRRKLTTNGECGTCHGKEESMAHILRDCSYAEEVWTALVGRDRWRKWSQTNPRQWLIQNITEKNQSTTQHEWPRTFVITSWWIWRWRNDRVFNTVSMETHRKIAWIHEAEKEVNRAFSREASMRSSPITEKLIKVCWKPSTTQRHTLNVDGSVKAAMRTASFGGILRSADGVWKGGFIGRSDDTEPIITELRAIVNAMKWVVEKGIRDVEIQSDASEAVRWIKERVTLRGVARELIHEAICWCAKDRSISLRAIYREQNRSADALALLGHCQTVRWKDYSSCPPECEEVYSYDLVRVMQCRRVRETS